METLEGRCEITPIEGLERLRFDAEGKLPPTFHHER
jgi:hypothetical protein